ncbi:hypothetical protein FSP39_011768 [Pinctada imbricata]|uniref:C1q domain-containing protein n=1 Tax=Pinctada imbricata TaxID=66713 RepID=A0AA88Y3E6_PINIB|nr:hypothetical protein FSP39_011768 [Pinctada imbricata]
MLMPPTDAAPDPDLQAVAFSASISHLFNSSVGPHHHFIYDSVETNVGNHYNQYTGTFTAPSKGVYVFAWSIETQGNSRTGSQHDGEIFTELIRNGSILGRLHADSELAWDDDSATGIKALVLNSGDVVYIRSGTYMEGDFYSGQHGGWTFSGWKI